LVEIKQAQKAKDDARLNAALDALEAALGEAEDGTGGGEA
jgi:hypothetical protein